VCSKTKPASFSSETKQNGFSISTLDLTSNYDAKVDLHYTLIDDSVCKQNAVPCKQAGSTIKNSQCGDAKKVDIYLSERYMEVYGQVSDLKVGIHNIAFDCNAPQEYNPPAAPTYAVTPVVSGYAADPYASPSACYSDYCGQKPSSSSTNASPSACYGDYCGQEPSSSSIQDGPSSVVSSTACYGDHCGQQPYSSSIRAQSSSIVSSSDSKYCNEGYGEGCASTKVSSTVTPAVPSSSTFTLLTSYQNSSTTKTSPTISASSVVSIASSSSSSQATSSGYPSYPIVEVPDVLPTCMNTWLQITTTDCQDNTAADCYCKSSKFTKSVIDCMLAWSKTEDEAKDNLRYLVGICAKYVPENPSLIEDCPEGTFNSPIIPSESNCTTTQAPANTPAPSGTPAAYNPVATIFYGSTSIAVPAVHFSVVASTPGATPSAVVSLVVGAAPPHVTAIATPIASRAPYPSSLSSEQRNSTSTAGTGAILPSKTKPSSTQFTGAASLFEVEAKHVPLGGALAFIAL
jgi:hypothetical protein